MGSFTVANTMPAAGYGRPRIGRLLDYVTPFAAYALFRTRRDYTGPLVKVRRASDNALMDIGFVAATGELDEAALLAFAGANGTVYVDTWYDQSGSGRHMSGALVTAGNSLTGLRLVNAGVIERLGSRACINSLGGSILTAQVGAEFVALGGQTSIALLSAPVQAATNRLLAATSSGGTNPHLDPLGLKATGAATWQYQSTDVSSTLDINGVASGTPHVLTNVDTGTAAQMRLDGTAGPVLEKYDRINTGGTFNRLCLFGQHRGSATAAGSVGGTIVAKVGAIIILPKTEDDFAFIEARLMKRAA